MNLLYPGKVLRKFTSILCKLISTHIWRHSGILSRCSEGPAPRALGCCLDSLAATMEARCRIWESLVKLPASSYVPESAGTMGDYSGDPGMVRVASARAALTLRDWRSWTNTSKIVHILHCSLAGLSSSCSLRWAAYQCTLAASPTLSLLSHSLTVCLGELMLRQACSTHTGKWKVMRNFPTVPLESHSVQSVTWWECFVL